MVKYIFALLLLISPQVISAQTVSPDFYCNSIYQSRLIKARELGYENKYSTKNDLYKFHCIQADHSRFDIRKFTDKTIGNWENFSITANKMKERYLPVLKQQLPAISEELLDIIFYTGVVGHLYPLGGVELSDKIIYNPRSVRQWYLNHHHEKKDFYPFEAYMYSPAGECNDFATVLYMLLKNNGYNAYHVGPDPSHINVEIQSGTLNIVADSTFLFVADISMKELFPNQYMGAPNLIKNIYILPNAGVQYGSRQYRSRRLQRNLEYFSYFGFRKLLPKDYSHWNRYNYYKKINGITSK